VRSSFGSLIRLARAGFVLARAGVFSEVDPSILPRPRGCARLGGLLAGPGVRTAGAKVLAKSERSRQSSRRDQPARAILCQAGHSSRRGRMSSASRLVQQLERLQDRMEPFRARSRLLPSRRPRRIARPHFRELRRAGFAAASIGSGPSCRWKMPRANADVAVKCWRPGVERLFRRDLATCMSRPAWPSAGAAMLAA